MNQVTTHSAPAPAVQPLRVGIAGAGVLGRLLAWQLARAGHRVTVCDPAPSEQPLAGGPPWHAAGFTAAGMLSPLAELECANAAVAQLGWRSISLWRSHVEELAQMGLSVYFAQRGSLLLAHGSDGGVAQRLLGAMQHKLPPPAQAVQTDQTGGEAPFQALTAAQLHALEPGIARQLRAWLLPGEGQIHTVQAMIALAQAASRCGAQFHWGHTVRQVAPHGMDGQAFDWVFDVRGCGARGDGAAGAVAGGDGNGDTHVPAGRCVDAHAQTAGAPHGAAAAPDFIQHLPAGAGLPAQPVRGVRGEVFTLHAPGVVLHRPVRLIHPRHRVYVVPRPGDLIVVGASEIESEDRSPVSLRSTVELLAAAHAVLPELTEARIIHSEVNLRPSLPDNLPRITHTPGLVRINGLFRHGWLIAPALVEQALHSSGLVQEPFHSIPA